MTKRLSFSAGSRRCAGEQPIAMRLLLAASTIMKLISFLVPGWRNWQTQRT